MADNPFTSQLECPECGTVDPSNFSARSNGMELGQAEALSFLMTEGETHALVRIECDNCGYRTARTVMNMER